MSPRSARRPLLASLAALTLFWTAAAEREARAAPILAPPGAAGHDPAVAALSRGYQREQDVFATRELGLSLNPFVKPDQIDAVKSFFAQEDTDDFQAQSGKHPFEVLDSFDEYGDEGNFAGVASVGVAARLMALRAMGAPEAEIAPAREAAVRAARAWHVYGSIGGPGVVARGIRRAKPLEAGGPPLPGQLPGLVPLEGADGKPLPEKKEDSWRAPVAPGFDGWIWLDNTSKDQVIGYVLAAGWLWDALRDDPAAPGEVADALAADLTAFARSLMKVAPELGIDLCIRDADGRLTRFHDLNARQVVPETVAPESSALRNGFNAAMAMAVIRIAYHVGGDPEVGKYFYEDLVGKRDYPRLMRETAGVVFTGPSTNYSNVNMLAMTLAGLGRFETDTYVRGRLSDTLDKGFWSTGDDRDVSHVKQAWFDAIYGAYGASPPSDIPERVASNLGGFQPAPAMQRDRMNCDEAEIAALSCVAVDGSTTIALVGKKGHNGSLVAKDIVPMAVRPDTDFAWRSDPHSANGGGSNRMNPGGDFLAAYWLARLSELGNPKANLSPRARPALPYTLSQPGEGGEGGSAQAGSAGSSGSAGAPGGGSAGSGGQAQASQDEAGGDPGGGCGCELGAGAGRGAGAALAMAAAAALLARSPRRTRKSNR